MESVAQEKAATELTPELKQDYVDVIALLFDGVITATPDQINNQVIVDVDTMMKEIAKCSQKMASFGFDVVYKLTLGSVIGMVIDSFIKRFATNAVVKATIKEWVKALASNYQFSACLSAAQVNWKSKVEIDLLEI